MTPGTVTCMFELIEQACNSRLSQLCCVIKPRQCRYC